MLCLNFELNPCLNSRANAVLERRTTPNRFSTNPSPIYTLLTKYTVRQPRVNSRALLHPAHSPQQPATQPSQAHHADLVLLSTLLLRGICNSENEVDDNSKEEDNSEKSRTISIIEASLPSHPDRPRTPVICDQGIDHGSHCNDCEEEGRYEGRSVAKVEHANGKSSEDDCEVQP